MYCFIILYTKNYLNITALIVHKHIMEAAQ